MRKLPLSQGKVALIDNEDYKRSKQYKWFFSTTGYAVRSTHNGKKGGTVYLHRYLLNAPRDKVVDHINGNKLDNRRSNLRLVTATDNKRNRVTARSKSGQVGVYWSKQNKKWNAQIGIDGKSKSLGFFDDLEKAVECRVAAEWQYWGFSSRGVA